MKKETKRRKSNKREGGKRNWNGGWKKGKEEKYKEAARSPRKKM